MPECKNCGNNVSKDVDSCPLCGEITAEGKADAKFANRIKGVFCLLFMGPLICFIGYYLSSTSHDFFMEWFFPAGLWAGGLFLMISGCGFFFMDEEGDEDEND